MARLTPEILLPFLLEYPHLLESRDEKKGGMTLLQRAVKQNNMELIKLLLLCNADPNTLSLDGKNSLFYAMFAHNPHISVPLLLEFGADPNMKISSWKGSTALHIASYRGMYYICRILIENGAKIDIENDQGLLPLQIYAKDPLAVEGGREERLRDVEDLLKGFEEVSTSICNNLPTYDDVVAKVARVHEAMNIQARQILDKYNIAKAPMNACISDLSDTCINVFEDLRKQSQEMSSLKMIGSTAQYNQYVRPPSTPTPTRTPHSPPTPRTPQTPRSRAQSTLRSNSNENLDLLRQVHEAEIEDISDHSVLRIESNLRPQSDRLYHEPYSGNLIHGTPPLHAPPPPSPASFYAYLLRCVGDSSSISLPLSPQMKGGMCFEQEATTTGWQSGRDRGGTGGGEEGSLRIMTKSSESSPHTPAQLDFEDCSSSQRGSFDADTTPPTDKRGDTAKDADQDYPSNTSPTAKTTLLTTMSTTLDDSNVPIHRHSLSQDNTPSPASSTKSKCSPSPTTPTARENRKSSKLSRGRVPRLNVLL